MRIIGQAGGVELSVPHDAYLSFFNSPYVGHERGTAIDVYPVHEQWGCPVLSPVDGRITSIRKMRMGLPKEFDTADWDHAIVIAPEGVEESVARIMHCEPALEEGAAVEKGAEIGTTIRSRYYNYWTGPHYHVEVMNRRDVHRSTKSLPLKVDLGATEAIRSQVAEPMELEAIRVSEDNVLLDGKGLNFAKVGRYKGLLAQTSTGSSSGILDAGVSHYLHGGMIGNEEAKKSDELLFQGRAFGEAIWSRGSLHHFLRKSLLLFDLEDVPVKGFSCYLYPKDYLRRGVPPIVAIPQTYGGFIGHIEEGTVYRLNINTAKGNLN